MRFEHKSILAQLYPPVAYQVNGENFLMQCEVDGNAFDRLQDKPPMTKLLKH